MITSKQRAKLRALANQIESIITIGKDGITENVIIQIDDALNAREIIKISVGKNCSIEPHEVLKSLCEQLNAEPVQVIGRKLVMYRKSEEKPRIQI